MSGIFLLQSSCDPCCGEAPFHGRISGGLGACPPAAHALWPGQSTAVCLPPGGEWKLVRWAPCRLHSLAVKHSGAVPVYSGFSQKRMCTCKSVCFCKSFRPGPSQAAGRTHQRQKQWSLTSPRACCRIMKRSDITQASVATV